MGKIWDPWLSTISPDCRASTHGSCAGGYCECGCHDRPFHMEGAQ